MVVGATNASSIMFVVVPPVRFTDLITVLIATT